MGKQTVVTLRCDVCGTDSKPQEGQHPKGWVEFSIEDSYEDRAWHEKALCPYCLKTIIEAKDKSNK